MKQQVYDVKGLAKVLKISDRSAYKLLWDGKIHAARVGSLWRISDGAVSDFLSGRGNGQEQRQATA